MEQVSIKALLVKIPRILVIGLERENQFSRAVESYGFEALYMTASEFEKSSSTNIDAAIICISHSSHNAEWKVLGLKRDYAIRVFIASHGFTEIKEDFEYYFLGKIREAFQNAPKVTFLRFLLGFLTRVPGSKISSRTFHKQAMRYIPSLTPYDIANFTRQAIKEGLITSESRGRYIFKGLGIHTITELIKYLGMPVPEEWMPIQAEIPKPVLEATSIVKEPVIELPKEQKTDLIADLLLHSFTELERAVKSTIQKPRPKEELMGEIALRLSSLSYEKLLALSTLLS